MKFEQYVLNESINDKGIFKALFMSGTPGAGKSYVISKISSGVTNPRIVNTDKFVEFFGNGGGVDWSIYGDKVETLTKNQLALYLNSLLPMWIDGTSSNPTAVIRRAGILKSFGYDVGLVWVETPLEDAIERASKRKRVVPEDYIRKVYNEILPLKKYYQNEFKFFKVVKNGNGELNDNAILDAYKQSSKFFESPVENPIGQKIYEVMKENNCKYFEDLQNIDSSFKKDLFTPTSIKNVLNSWYN